MDGKGEVYDGGGDRGEAREEQQKLQVGYYPIIGLGIFPCMVSIGQ
jgi:hypothetical protein